MHAKLFAAHHDASITSILNLDAVRQFADVMLFADWWPRRDELFVGAQNISTYCCVDCRTRQWVVGCKSVHMTELVQSDATVLSIPSLFHAWRMIEKLAAKGTDASRIFQLHPNLMALACTERRQCAMHVRGGDGQFARDWRLHADAEAAELCALGCRNVFVATDVSRYEVRDYIIESFDTCKETTHVNVSFHQDFVVLHKSFESLLPGMSPAYVALFLDVALAVAADEFVGRNGSTLTKLIRTLRTHPRCDQT